jgi:hypothetical protein
MEAQLFQVQGINISDVNDDEKKDIFLVGSSSVILMGDSASWIDVGDEARDVQTLKDLYLVTRNNDSLVVFKKRNIK